MLKRTIKLQPTERDRLLKLVSQGQHRAKAIRRAYLLLPIDAGCTDEGIVQFLFCGNDAGLYLRGRSRRPVSFEQRLLPFFFAAVPIGLDAIIDRIAARRRT